MWILCFLVLLAVVAGLLWAYHNHSHIQKVDLGNIGSQFHVEEELHNINVTAPH